MTLTDEELERDWQPSGRRPQSTIARNFQLELEDIFGLEKSASGLDQQLDERKQNIGKNSQELASLEARIREMEERLSRTGYHLKVDAATAASSSSFSSSKRDALADDANNNNNSSSSSKARSRPGTARATQQAPSSGNMPPTPGASEDGHGE